MGRITSVTIGMQRKYQHPYVGFESFQIEGSVTAEVDEGEDPIEVARKSFPVLRAQMIETYKQFKPKREGDRD